MRLNYKNIITEIIRIVHAFNLDNSYMFPYADYLTINITIFVIRKEKKNTQGQGGQHIALLLKL